MENVRHYLDAGYTFGTISCLSSFGLVGFALFNNYVPCLYFGSTSLICATISYVCLQKSKKIELEDIVNNE